MHKVKLNGVVHEVSDAILSVFLRVGFEIVKDEESEKPSVESAVVENKPKEQPKATKKTTPKK